MAEFTGDIAGMLELFAIAGGLVLLHRAGKEAPAKLLQAAGWVLIIGGISVGACTTFYWFQYQSRGEFESAHMDHSGMMHSPGTGMGPGMMGSGMMGPGMMGPGMTAPGMTGPGLGSMPHGGTPPADGAR